MPGGAPAWPLSHCRKDSWQHPHAQAALGPAPLPYGGFPFPLELVNKRAPLPPRYSHQDLEDLLPPSAQEPPSLGEYTAISYYHSRVPHGGVRLSRASPSYANSDVGVELPPARGQPPVPPHYAGSDQVESDYGSCEEVMF